MTGLECETKHYLVRLLTNDPNDPVYVNKLKIFCSHPYTKDYEEIIQNYINKSCVNVPLHQWEWSDDDDRYFFFAAVFDNRDNLGDDTKCVFIIIAVSIDDIEITIQSGSDPLDFSVPAVIDPAFDKFIAVINQEPEEPEEPEETENCCLCLDNVNPISYRCRVCKEGRICKKCVKPFKKRFDECPCCRTPRNFLKKKDF